LQQAPHRDSGARRGTPANATAAGDLGLPSVDPSQAHATDGGDVGSVDANQTMDLPEDASPATLPFTGLQLALMALFGVAIVAAGLTLRRSAMR
jgi:hypothetical protein